MFYHCSSDSCEFEFFSGYSRDHGWSWALCQHCDALYCLPTKDRMVYPDVDELIEVRRLIREPVKHRGRKKHIPWTREVYEPTGQFVIAQPTVGEAPSFRWFKYIGIDELECAACKSAGQIAIDLCAGDACPRCKTGKIKLKYEGMVVDC